MIRYLAAATTAALVLLLPIGDTADAHRHSNRGDRLHVRHHRAHNVVRHGRGTHGRYRGDRVRAKAIPGGIQLDHDGRWMPSLSFGERWDSPTEFMPQSRARRAGQARSRLAHHGDYRAVCAGGHCGNVMAQAARAFSGLFVDLVAAGYNIGSPGCLASGHMRFSKHHWGGACDLFNQIARDRTALRQPPPRVQIELARKHGLTSGCAWRNRDCGHFEVKGGTYARAN